MDELVIGEKRYVSSKRAAEITGYAKDYVGQLCREGYVVAKMVGRSWYVLEDSIREHRFGPEKRVGATNAAPLIDTEKEILDVFSDYAADVSEDTAPEEAKNPVSDWERPVYRAEVAPEIPEIGPRAENTTIESEISATPASPETESSIADMQAAWKEWFEQKRNEGSQTNTAGENENEANADPEHDLSEEETYIDDVEEEQADMEGSNIAITRQVEARDHTEDEGGVNDATEENRGQEGDTEPIRIPLHKIRPQAPYISDIKNVPVQVIGAPTVTNKSFVASAPIAPHTPNVSTRNRAISGSTKKQGSLAATAVLIGVAGVAVAIAMVGSGYADAYVDNPITDFLGGTSTISK